VTAARPLLHRTRPCRRVGFKGGGRGEGGRDGCGGIARGSVGSRLMGAVEPGVELGLGAVRSDGGEKL
jgi:hypothetical protein